MQHPLTRSLIVGRRGKETIKKESYYTEKVITDRSC